MLENTFNGWSADRAPRLGASLAFYTLLSVAPMLLVVVAIAGFVFGREAAEGRLVWQIQGFVGRQGATVIQGLLKGAWGPKSGMIATVTGVVGLFFGATALVTELRDALNTIWHVPPPPSASNWESFIRMMKRRAFSFIIVIGVGLLLMLSLLLNTGLAAVGAYLAGMLPMAEWVLQTTSALVSFAVVVFLFSLLYRVLPDVDLTWGDVLVGAVGTSILFTLGKTLIAFYLGKAVLSSTYGAAGSLVLLLLWVYYSAQVFFFGAEFTCVYAHRHGTKRRSGRSERLPRPTKIPVTEGRTSNAQDIGAF